MKSALFIFALSISLNAFAASNASDVNYRFCEDISRVDKLLDRSRETVERFQSEKLNVERIVVSKDRKELYLISGDVVLKKYPVAFGFTPVGHKQFQGDGKTPEGIYFVDYKNPKSLYTKALHVSYPNKADIAYAKSQGRKPGGDIMIHGLPSDENKRQEISLVHPYKDWTEGCVAVNNEQIEEIYALAQENVVVEICAVTAKDK